MNGFSRTLSIPTRTHYTFGMKTTSDTSSSWPLARIWAGIGIVAAIAVVLVTTLAGWATHGTTILFTYAQDGLAWCF
jgi:hypothetical protein